MSRSVVIARLSYPIFALSILLLLPIRHWLFECLSNFGLYLLLFHLLFIALLPLGSRGLNWRRLSLLWALNLAFVAYYVQPLAVLYLPSSLGEATHGTQRVRIVYANVKTTNQRVEPFIALIREKAPDIVVVLETDISWQAALRKGLSSELQQLTLEQPRDDNFGMAVYGRFPLSGPGEQNFGDDLQPGYIAPLDIGKGREMTLVALHAVPPLSNAALYRNYLLLRRTSSVIRNVRGPLVVVGDFNATPYSSYYREFRRWSNVKPAAAGYGWLVTWNAEFWPFRLMIDHVFVKGALTVQKLEVLTDINSDHYPLMVDLEL